MLLINRLRSLFTSAPADTDPEKAYDLWAAAYDTQPDNLMLALDSQLFSAALEQLTIENKQVVDVGCGTGRHWEKLLSKHPQKLTGYDVSAGMLEILQQKFPGQEARKLNDEKLSEPDASCDLLISTLTMAHIPDAAKALAEWMRVVKPGGSLLITDYHPDALARGGNRTFRHQGKTVAVKNHVYSIAFLVSQARQLGLELICISEKHVDEAVRHYYEKQNALQVYEKFKGVPIIYSLHLKKKNAVA